MNANAETSLADPESLNASVYADLRVKLITGVLKPAEAVSIRKLAKSYGVSTMPVREALRQLASEGALNSAARKTFRVPDLTTKEASNLFFVRGVLEGAAAEIASQRVTTKTLSLLEKFVEKTHRFLEARDAQGLRQHLTELTSKAKDEAYCMPSHFYTSEEFLELEKEQIFRNEWFCIGHVGEVSDPGDFYTTELVGEQLLVARDDEGEINVLSNVCRHRGNLVVPEASGNRRSFVCPYHAWTYTRDGTLKTAPLMKKAKAFDAAKCSLPKPSTEIWNNFIFVNLDGTAKPLATQLASLDGILHNYHHELRNLLFMEETVWNTNWKSLNESFRKGIICSQPTQKRYSR